MVANTLVVSRSEIKDATITVPGDKSISHRALIISSIADGQTVIHDLLESEDIGRTVSALQALGIAITRDQVRQGSQYVVEGKQPGELLAADTDINCGNSGTAIRLLAGLLAGQSFSSRLVGDSSLATRPMIRIAEPLTRMGAKIELSPTGTAPIVISGNNNLKAIDYKLPVASAQVKSAILLAGLTATGTTRVTEPRVCRDHTERMLEAFNADIVRDGSRMSVSSRNPLRSPGEIHVPGDLSSAAFFLVLAAISGKTFSLPNVGVNPTRDGVIHLLRRMGAKINLLKQRTTPGGEPSAELEVMPGALEGIEISKIDVALAIDEIPALLIAAACARGKTILKGANELRIKESDRLKVMAKGLQMLGINVEETHDGLIVEGSTLRGGEVDSHGDHRAAMAFAIAGTVATGAVKIRDCKNVATSYPAFIDNLRQVGAQVEEINK